jgi:HD-like signal output (HDOD) protein
VQADPLDAGALAEWKPEERTSAAPEPERRTAIAAQVRAKLAGGTLELPSFPPLAAQVLAIVEHPQFDTNELVRVIQRDPVAAAELLRISNSALYLGGSAVESLRDAVVRLGANATAQAVSAISAKALFDLEARATHAQYASTWAGLWEHATVVAFTCSWLSMTYRKGNMDRAFLGGMLHELGKNVALRSLSVMATAEGFGEPPAGALLHGLLEDLHVECGAALAASWNLPAPVATILREHHAEAPPADQADLHIVRLVSGLDELRCNPWHRSELPEVVHASAAALGLSKAQLQALVTQLRELAKKTQALV